MERTPRLGVEGATSAPGAWLRAPVRRGRAWRARGLPSTARSRCKRALRRDRARRAAFVTCRLASPTRRRPVLIRVSYPVVLEDLGGAEARRVVGHNERRDERLGCGRYFGADWVVVALAHTAFELVGLERGEGARGMQHLIQHASERPHVDGLAVIALMRIRGRRDFRCQVRGGAAVAAQLLVVALASEPKVTQLEVEHGGGLRLILDVDDVAQQHIGRLKVPMHHAYPVQVRERARELEGSARNQRRYHALQPSHAR